MTASGYGVSLGSDKKIFWNQMVVMIVQLCKYTKKKKKSPKNQHVKLIIEQQQLNSIDGARRFADFIVMTQSRRFVITFDRGGAWDRERLSRFLSRFHAAAEGRGRDWVYLDVLQPGAFAAAQFSGGKAALPTFCQVKNSLSAYC